MTHAAPEHSDPLGASVSDGLARQLAESLSEAFRGLAKAIRFRRLYTVEHDFYRKAVAEVVEKLSHALEVEAEIDVEVATHQFKYDGKVIFADERGPQNLPFRFYKDGIQSITLRQGVTAEEIARVIEAVRTDETAWGGDDLAIRLWSAQLASIEFCAVDELDPDAADDVEAPKDAVAMSMKALAGKVAGLVERLTARPMPSREQAQRGGFARLVSVGAKDLSELGKTEAPPMVAGVHASLPGTAHASAATLWQLRNEAELPRRTIAILRRAAEKSELGDAEARAAELSSDLIRAMIEEDRLDSARATLSEVSSTRTARAPRAAGFSRKVLHGLSSPKGVDAILRALNQPRHGAEELSELLDSMDDATIAAIAPLYPRLRGTSGRAAALETILDRALAHPELLGPVVSGGDPTAARAALKAVSKEGPAPWPILLGALQNPTPEVRADGLKAMTAEMIEARAADVAARLEDPSIGVRRLAARRLAESAGPFAVAALRGRLGNIPAEMVEERLELLRLLATCDPGAGDVLIAHAGPRQRRMRWIPLGPLDELRRQLPAALKSVKGVGARDYLARCAGSDDTELAALARAALGGPS